MASNRADLQERDRVGIDGPHRKWAVKRPILGIGGLDLLLDMFLRDLRQERRNCRALENLGLWELCGAAEERGS